MFRLKLSNNKLEDVNTANNLSSLTHANRLKINRNSTGSKMTPIIPNNNYNNNYPYGQYSRTSTFYSSLTSKTNSISTTPTEINLPVILDTKKKSRKLSKSSLTLSATKKSSLNKIDIQQREQINTTPITPINNNINNESCNCILCNSNFKKSINYRNYISLNSSDMFILDSKNFLNCLNRMKPTIKLERDSNFSELGYLASTSQTSTDFISNQNLNVNTLNKIKNNNEVIKLLPANSRIKLWEPDEVLNYINNEDAKKNCYNETVTTVLSSSSNANDLKKSITNSRETLNQEHSKPVAESRLNKILKQFRLNPNFSPLLYKSNHNTATISFQQVLTPSTVTKPVMPILSKTPTIMYRVPMNSALNFYDC